MKKYAVLIVEDYVDLQQLMGEYLELQGMVVWKASSCKEALALLEQFRPDLILSAVKLLDGDAYSLLKQWREREAAEGWEPTPAIAISKMDQAEQEPLARAAGFQAFVAKPFDVSHLQAKIELILSKN